MLSEISSWHCRDESEVVLVYDRESLQDDKEALPACCDENEKL
jgi:hypothetical protein